MKLSLIHICGGYKSDVWNQIKADVLGVSVAMPHTGEAASLGAAVLGGIACGIFPNISAPVKKLKTKEAYLPDRNLADTSVSYTHLDVYKRQPILLSICRFSLPYAASR